MGVSVDSVPSHEAWQKSLGGVSFPLCSDFYPHGEVADKYGILRVEGISERAIFIIDTDGVVQYINVHPIDKQPDNEVVLAELAKL